MSQRHHRRFDAHYREHASLADGTLVELRLLTPADAPLLREGFRHLSSHSRVMRFLHDKHALSEAELRYLTEVDGERHFALGAVVLGPDGTEEGLGTARFVRLEGEPDTAEAAVTVIDAYQGRGLGRLLLARLVEAARERGLTRIACWVMPGNVPMQRLMEALGPSEASSDGEALLYTVPLPATPAAPGELLLRMLALAAEGALVLLGRVLRHGERMAPARSEGREHRDAAGR
ncbi:MAG: GNAT family N-acetyltransferase [Myxococcaceae bacterium]|nr:GNAT family N-acetyltransferase [Myxococcaceae bacterium]MCI0670107.1 GNAT family N-acetyltransferase [Myxococcaceae bacterium]